ncbi:alpha-hydroxy acid oxidase [Aidingimonas halophila]|uniref:L-lactate dehydrogenase (Cytochrome) n=1 Tax=Aidingimonas halophila TaxID=574349 RepID=A0A1H2ZWE0_9GAMM|nr:alpha-hydroxy acid oxidase [Aidingimonas halophila]GHC16715.1 alpha-hydroxy-acid oxidizing enzyme [Aidingimonas halophila]SDX20979.1 L-lactate dehydrogenase (cytochrome) [Aidingimonas halophila]
MSSETSTLTKTATSPVPRPSWLASRRLKRVFCLDDFEPAAKRFLPRPIFGYVSGAAETNVSYRDNRAVFDEYGFMHRVLRNVSEREQSISLLGRRYAAPFGIAPMGISSLTGYRGDLAQAQAAERAGIPMILSASSLIRLEEVVEAAPHTWFQAYLPAESERIAALVDRVARAGVETLVVTVDSAVVPNRENNLRNGFKTPLSPDLKLLWDGLTHPSWSMGTFVRTLVRHGMPHFENNAAERGAAIVSRHVARDFSGREHLDWGELRRIRRQWQGRLIIKGVLHPDDVATARDHGADGVILSNHGGRQLDGAISPMRVLPQAVDTAGDMAVMIDSGFRRGTDVIKALALGAQCAFVGRPFNYAAAIGGEAGVDYAIRMLMSEIRADMGMLGITRLEELEPSMLVTSRMHRA